MTDRYQDTFAELKIKNEAAFIPFWMIGDPNPTASFEIIDAMAEHADILELGMPFSDPLADGPTIQASINRALKSGTTIDDCFDVIEKIRAKHEAKPIGLLVYFNLALQYGVTNFFARCKAVGVDSVILPELPVESIEMADPNDPNSGSIIDIAKAESVDLTFLVSTNTPEDRLRSILDHATGFLYAISKPSITGAKTDLAPETVQMVLDLKQKTSIPICVGFGISEPDQVRALASSGADGCIIGSRLYEFQDDLGAMSEFCAACKEATKVNVS